jgi:hypothetical protein
LLTSDSFFLSSSAHPAQSKHHQAQAARLKVEKEILLDKQAWQSAGRKDIIAAEAAALKQYEKQLIDEARIKSEQFRAVRGEGFSALIF